VITVTAVAATTFTATFVNAHPALVPLYAMPSNIGNSGSPLLGGPLVSADVTTEPARIAPGYGQIWPIVRQQLATVQVNFVAGYGPVTTIPAGVPAAGLQVVTPASMTGIYPYTQLVVDLNPNQERVTVSAVTATTFTAVFAQAHAANVGVLPGVPEPLRQAIKLMVGHWYENREAVVAGSMNELPLAIQSLISLFWCGEYE
jgi:hypothetical protein